MGVEVLTVSSKGQISIPLEIIKPIRIPSEDDFEQLLDEAQKWAASVGYQESDVNDISSSPVSAYHNHHGSSRSMVVLFLVGEIVKASSEILPFVFFDGNIVVLGNKEVKTIVEKHCKGGDASE